MRPPASEPENRTHGAKKIGPSQYSDFFNKIDPSLPFAALNCRTAKGSFDHLVGGGLKARRERQARQKAPFNFAAGRNKLCAPLIRSAGNEKSG